MDGISLRYQRLSQVSKWMRGRKHHHLTITVIVTAIITVTTIAAAAAAVVVAVAAAALPYPRRDAYLSVVSAAIRLSRLRPEQLQASKIPSDKGHALIRLIWICLQF
ncbi:unnamed protein product [Brugia pahangi]|uniref:Uncharacterized protein n=1 Tax=Brugia pahangi TaxID=6280 RepID=A0A0N4TIM0_BRUPA|nr:unnamed protein product [Brugia pahangi]